MAEPLAEPCRPLSPEVLKAFGGETPGFVGHQSVACEEVGDNQIAVGVYATARPRARSGDASPTLYGAWMLTDPTHLAEDARSFEAFLGTARIPAPSRQVGSAPS
ncbi:MAG: hypothetical protein IR159_03985 [Brevundimonas sp.]|nr:hypothetical protein [Brevundimonas sp.]